jgi:hypothetical protein
MICRTLIHAITTKLHVLCNMLSHALLACMQKMKLASQEATGQCLCRSNSRALTLGRVKSHFWKGFADMEGIGGTATRLGLLYSTYSHQPTAKVS